MKIKKRIFRKAGIAWVLSVTGVIAIASILNFISEETGISRCGLYRIVCMIAYLILLAYAFYALFDFKDRTRN